jgi:hypothetical protein
MKFLNHLFLISLIAIGSLIPIAHLNASNNLNEIEYFQHNVQLQLFDSMAFPVSNTTFWVTLDIIKEGPKVTIQFPLINFETGPIANVAREIPFLPPLVPGGYLYTVNGFLPECVRPNDLVPRSVIAASNNGLSPVYLKTQPVDTLPQPPAGYILQVTNAGGIVVQCAGTFGNIIPSGPQILLPTSMTYIVKPKEKLCKNTVLSNGATNTTQFTGNQADNGFRDSHVNDAFNGVCAWGWADNSMIADKTNGTMNMVVAIGQTTSKGKLKVGPQFQLTNLAAGIEAWDTAIAINRTDSTNIIASWGQIDPLAGDILYRAVSFDDGKTWPENGPLNVQPSGGFGDARGVSSDKFGNIWYSATDNNGFIPPVFYVSTDKGVTFELIFTAPDPGAGNYDYPQFCFGGDGQGNYGLLFQCTLFTPTSEVPTVGFIPITGLGAFGTPIFTQLSSLAVNGLVNSAVESDVAASLDGRFWMQGIPISTSAYTFINPIVIAFKSPGPIDQNYAGAWHTIILGDNEFEYNISDTISQPDKGYIFHSAQSILYDETRQALYAVIAAQVPDFGQNMRLFFIISRDNGQTWSDAIDISTTNFANRGFQSMALDEITGDLIFGWYDGRNDPTYQSVEYYAGIVPSRTLDSLVSSIPLSNPLYTLPSIA